MHLDSLYNLELSFGMHVCVCSPRVSKVACFQLNNIQKPSKVVTFEVEKEVYSESKVTMFFLDTKFYVKSILTMTRRRTF